MGASAKPIPFAGSQLHGKSRHVCAFFNSDDEEYRVLLPFIKGGFERGDKAVHVVNPARRADHVRRLEAAGIDSTAAQRTGQLELRSNTETYLRDGRFDKDRMVEVFEEFASGSARGAFPLSRIVCHMDWAVEERSHLDALVEFESRVNDVWARHDDAVICVYDLAKFGGATVLDMVRTHPLVIVGGILQQNPFFLPPDEFLREVRERQPQSSEMLSATPTRWNKRPNRWLQGCINDLISVLALPAMWTGQDPAQVVGTLLESVVGVLRLDFACAWLKPEGSAPGVEMVRMGESPPSTGAEPHIASALDRWLADDPNRWPARVPNPVGAGDVSIVPLRLGLQDDVGVIVAASTRPGFPCDTERLLLSVAANQAAIGLQEVRLLSEQRRIAKELDGRVAERTAELAAANEELRSITDAIPQAVTVLAPDGSTLYVNAFVLAYTGLSLEDAKSKASRDEIVHPDDLERVRHERQVGLSRGEPFESELRARRKDGQYRWFLVRYHPLRSENGEILRWYATATDIEDRRRMEERVRNENLALRDEIDRSSMFEEIVGSSEGLRRVLAQVAKVAPTDSTVLIVGETGTGKELIARAIHKCSSRASRAFIRVNCAAIPPSLVASELFGHEKGAFTGALQRRVGRFEAADGGTIFLDEIGDLQAETQVALLRVLQEREFERVGSSRPVPVDVRVLAATHRDLSAAVKAGSFREDLFYRFNVFPLEIPPLRERRDDILLLVQYMIERYAKKAGKRIKSIDKDTLEMFRAYAWPGNVRELQNVVERAVILSDGDTFVVDASWLRREASQVPGPAASLAGALAANERELIEAALAACKGRVSGPAGAAARLGIPRQTLDSKIRALHIDKYKFRAA